MAIDIEKLLRDARRADEEFKRQNGGKNYIGHANAAVGLRPPKVKSTESTIKIEPPKRNVKINNKKKPPVRKRKLDESTRKLQLEAVSKHALPKAMYNYTEGFLEGTTLGFYEPEKGGKNAETLKKIRDGKLAKASRFAGEMTAYAAPYSAGKNILAKGATKAVGTKLGTKAVGKVAASKLGRKVGADAVRGVAHAVAEDAIGALTIGEVQNVGMALSEGKRGKELAKDIALNTGIDLLAGGVMSVGGEALSNAISKAISKSAAKNAAKIPVLQPNGRVKYTAAPTTTNIDPIKGLTAKQGAKLAAKEAVNEATEDVASEGVRFARENGKIVPKIDIQPIKADVGTGVPKPKITPPDNVRKAQIHSEYVKDLVDEAAPIKVGRATIIKSPYNGKTPKQLPKAARKKIEISLGSVEKVRSMINTAANKSEIKKRVKAMYGGRRIVNVIGTSIDFKPYAVEINNSGIGKLISSTNSPEVISVLEKIDDIIQNSEYVGSGSFISNGKKAKETIRFDYFEKDIHINGKDYIVKIDVEVFPGKNNYKVHRLKEISLTTSKSGELGRQPNAEKLVTGFIDDIVPQNGTNVNPKLKPNGADVHRELPSNDENIRKYGAMPKTGWSIPNRTDYGKVSEGARTVLNSKALRDNPEARETLKQAVAEGAYFVTESSNRKALEESFRAVSADVDGTLAMHRAQVLLGKNASIEDMARGVKLGEELAVQGRFDEMNEVFSDVAMWASDAGKTLQAMRMLKALSPSGRMHAVSRITNKIKFNTGVNVEIPKELLLKYSQAVEEADIYKIQKEISVAVWNQVPATFAEKVTAWRYLSMLGNLKTHVRNFVGNAIFMPARAIKDTIAAGLESVSSKKIAKYGGARTKAFVTYSGEDKKLREAGKQAFLKVQDALLQNSFKYSDSFRDIDSVVFDGKHASKFLGERVGSSVGKGLEALRKANSSGLERADNFFMGANFQTAFAEFCKANNIKASELTDDIIRAASDYAQDEALKATYRDFNALAEWVNGFRPKIKADDTLGLKAAKTTEQLLMDAAIPFRRTPANILRRGIEYSPMGLMQGCVNIVRAIMKKDGQGLTKAIDRVAAGTTGSFMVALGYYLASKGIANGKLGYDKESNFKKHLGEQDYAVTIPILGNECSVTADWAAPMSMPFFVGVELQKMLKETDDPISVVDAIMRLPGPVLNLSLLRGINNVFSTQFGADDGLGSGGEIINNAAQNYALQYIPTVFGQAARTFTPTRKTTISTAQSATARWADKTMQRAMNKIPGLASSNEDYIDIWGEPERKEGIGDYLRAGLENFVFPAYAQKKTSMPVERELLNLSGKLDSEGRKDIMPPMRTTHYDLKLDDNEYRMTEGDVTEYSKIKGQYSQRELQKLMSSDEYAEMTAEEKKDAIAKVYTEAGKYAKELILVNRNVVTQEEFDYGLIKSEKQKGLVDSGAITATKLRALKNVEKTRAATEGVEKAYIALDMGLNKNFIEAYTSEETLKKAEAVKRADLSYESLKSFNSKIDSYEADSRGEKAYIALKEGIPADVASALISESAVEKAMAAKRLGVTYEQYSTIQESKERYGKATYAQAYAMLEAGTPVKVVNAVLEQKGNRAVQSAIFLKMAGIAPDEVIAIKDRLGTTKKEVVAGYLSQTDFTRQQKWAIFNAISTAKHNPFG